MLEQLPDTATAKLATQAAASGHFILAGMHADDALHALLQVEAMGVEPFMLGHALQGVISQQLVRKLCERCRERYALSRDEQTLIAKTFGMTSVTAFKRVHELERQALEAKLSIDGRANTTPAAVTHLWRASADGCAACGHSGYDGQVGVVEILGNGAQLQKAFLAADASAKTVSALHSAALKDGFVPLLLDGFIKALCGQTTVEQLVPQLAQTS
jgi:type II secretory ATPase GspE/PulE/Tfp pilus assembly ATPase PilB-like protein